MTVNSTGSGKRKPVPGCYSGTYFWTPATAAAIGPAGSDDISNFAPNVLSAGS